VQAEDDGDGPEQVYEEPVAVGVPQGPLGENEVGSELLSLLAGFNDIFKVIGHGGLLENNLS
jgi:hypothetical protein